MNKEKHNCPICNTELQFMSRYPNYVCNECAHKSTDANGRKLSFFNIDIWGGFKGEYSDTNEEYTDHICYIDKIKCYADEARFGGIVIEVLKADLD